MAQELGTVTDYPSSKKGNTRLCQNYSVKKYNIDNRLIEVIRSLYDETTSAVSLNVSVGDFFRTTNDKGIIIRMPIISSTI